MALLADSTIAPDFNKQAVLSPAEVILRIVQAFDACEKGAPEQVAIAADGCRVIAFENDYPNIIEAEIFINAMEKIAGTSSKNETLFMTGRYKALENVDASHRSLALAAQITGFGDKSELAKIPVRDFTKLTLAAILPLPAVDYRDCLDTLVASIDSGSRSLYKVRANAYDENMTMAMMESIRDFVTDSPHFAGHELLSKQALGLVEAWTPRRNDGLKKQDHGPKK